MKQMRLLQTRHLHSKRVFAISVFKIFLLDFCHFDSKIFETFMTEISLPRWKWLNTLETVMVVIVLNH